LSIRLADLPGLRVTVMGLGLHGGGLASALFFARHGARVTVTDNRGDPSVFEAALAQLRPLGVRTVLGRHEPEDFQEAELVLKNPAVPPTSPFLRLASSKGVPIETDLSVFLQLCANPLVGVTGSKGKSTTAAAIHSCLAPVFPGARLGGNITVSPLSFLEGLEPRDPVVLELSSWQLADLRGRGLLDPKVAVLTVILPDHQDRYPDMSHYIADKRVLFESQSAAGYAVLNRDDPLQEQMAKGLPGQLRWFSRRPLPAGLKGAFLEGPRALLRCRSRAVALALGALAVPGEHNRLNLLAAALACRLLGLPPGQIVAALRGFRGVEHRLELVAEVGGVRYYNDSAATIPEATAAGLRSLEPPLLLITGGTDKKLDFRPLLAEIHRAKAVLLLAGSGTDKIAALLSAEGIPYAGPFPNLERTLEEARRRAAPGDTVLFSPACASFELFLNEFDRGRRFKELVGRLGRLRQGGPDFPGSDDTAP
jgi:UDP-N-acetylmuramoylalanine--D-glutamate ligase